MFEGESREGRSEFLSILPSSTAPGPADGRYCAATGAT